ncbi:FAD-dependent monooxygenase [Streptomyces sp. URMC 123]|uniref:FAD-dependent monooxygenase n=1 Tax=Streptomyces sp. URMC 123 TaxID=3423403 RepID=UPI003F1B5F2A
MIENDVDVVVAGAGPVGLMLACELRLGGARVAVLERLTEVDPTIKAGAINVPSSVAFYRRGMLPAMAEAQRRTLERFGAFAAKRPESAAASLVASGDAAPAGSGARSSPIPGAARRADAPKKFVGHFAGIMLAADLVDTAGPGFEDAGPAADTILVPQQDIERVLGERAAELGVDLRRGVELTGFDADADGVTVHTAPVAGGAPGAIRAGWLVGCDGGRSTVRKLAGFDFPGTAPEITGRQAIVDMTGAEALGTGWNRTDTGIYAHGPIPGRILTVEFDGPPADRTAPVTPEEVQGSLRRVTGVDVTVHAVHTATRFTDNARQVGDYRRGRVLLAGDAAHVHSPFGGQGLNLGIGDAMNLGWKLAAVVRGWAPEGLLDTYTAERHPIGAWVLEWTRAQIALMRPDAHARALRAVVADLAGTVTGTTYFARKISGVWQRYDLPGDHPAVGASAPDLVFADGTRLADLLHGGRGLLLDLSDDARLRAHAAGYGDRVDVVTAACPDRPELAALLVRPDGFVAWAADTGRTGSAAAGAAATGSAAAEPASMPGAGLADSLCRWFGAPVAARAAG